MIAGSGKPDGEITVSSMIGLKVVHNGEVLYVVKSNNQRRLSRNGPLIPCLPDGYSNEHPEPAEAVWG